MDKLDVFYTRYSSDMQRPESCEDQEREIRSGLAKLGAACGQPLVIKDHAESGTKSARDGFTRMMELVQAGRVRLLAVDDQSRFSRADHAFMLINDVVFFGGRFISTGEGIDTNQEGWQLRVKVMELHNSTTIRELGRRVRRGQKGRVLDQNGAAGDHCFGYRSEYVDPNWAQALAARGPKPKKIVAIHEPEAGIVRIIFALFVAGWSLGAIVRRLNGEKVPKGHRSTTPTWGHHNVRRILGNTKYVGHWTWGTTVTVRDSRGRKRQVPSTTDQSVTVERPDLRIIDDETWKKAQALLQKLENVFGKRPNQKSRAARVHHTELYPASLLGGLVSCSTCGSRMTMQFSNGRTYLGCTGHRKGTCPMVARVPMDRAEKAVMDLVVGFLTSNAEWVSEAIASMRRALTELSTTVPNALAADQRRLGQLEKQIQNLVDVMANGLDQSSAIRDRLSALEADAGALREKIDQQRAMLARPVELPDDAWIRDQLADLVPILREDTPAAAILLRKLLGKVTAYEVKIRGKQRRYAQLRFRIDVLQTLNEVLDDHAGVIASANTGITPADSPEFVIDLRNPSRMDDWAPKIAELHAQGVAWNEIGRIAGMSPGNAWTAWKRWMADNSGNNAAA